MISFEVLWLAESQGLCIPLGTGSAVVEICSLLWKTIVKSKTKEWCPMEFMKNLKYEILEVVVNTVGASVAEKGMQAKALHE